MKQLFTSMLACALLISFGCGCSTNQYENGLNQPFEQLDNTNMMPNSSEVGKAYGKAFNAFCWFDIESLAYDETESRNDVESKEVDGLLYYKIDNSSLKTYSDMQKHLHSLFSDEIVEELLNGDTSKAKYKDIDGHLYGTVTARGPDSSKGEQTHEIIHESSNKFVYKVTVKLLGDDMKETGESETHDYNYEYVNGKWVFTNFDLFI